MTDFLIYNLKAGFILSVLYVLYVVLLRKETYLYISIEKFTTVSFQKYTNLTL